jgi:hypothetical protein
MVIILIKVIYIMNDLIKQQKSYSYNKSPYFEQIHNN